MLLMGPMVCGVLPPHFLEAAHWAAGRQSCRNPPKPPPTRHNRSEVHVAISQIREEDQSPCLAAPGPAIAASLFAVALTGCSSKSATEGAAQTGSNRPADTTATSSSSTSTAPASVTTAPASVTTPPPPPPAPSTSTTTKKPGPAKLGSTYKWANGLSATISKPEPFNPSSSAAGAKEAKAFVKFTVTVVNGTSQVYAPSMFSTSAQSGNTEAKPIYDYANGITGSPSTKLLPGRQAKFTVAFGVADPNDLVVQVRPGFDYDDFLFVS